MSPTRHHAGAPVRQPLAHREEVEQHFHDRNQLVTPGRGVLEVTTDAGVWIVPAQRAVWLPAGVAHGHRAHGATELRSLVFAPEVNPLRLDRPTVLAVSPLLREVVAALTTDPGPDPAERAALEQVAQHQLRHAPALGFCLPAPRDPRLRDLHALLDADPADPRTLAQLGRAVGASERTLSRLFHTETGMGFPRWRAQLRLHRALILLSRGDSVTSVAAASGYRSPSAFIESFRLAFNTTPARYQRDT